MQHWYYILCWIQCSNVWLITYTFDSSFTNETYSVRIVLPSPCYRKYVLQAHNRISFVKSPIHGCCHHQFWLESLCHHCDITGITVLYGTAHQTWAWKRRTRCFLPYHQSSLVWWPGQWLRICVASQDWLTDNLLLLTSSHHSNSPTLHLHKLRIDLLIITILQRTYDVLNLAYVQ